MANILKGERLSDGLNADLKKSKKLYRLTQNTYQEIVKMFENPSNIKLAEEQLATVLKMEKEDQKNQRSKKFADVFSKPVKVKMPYTANKPHRAK